MQNIVVFTHQPEHTFDIGLKAGNMCLNRFCIDEDASFKLSGVYDWKFQSTWNEQELTEAGKGNYPSELDILAQILYHELRTPLRLSVRPSTSA